MEMAKKKTRQKLNHFLMKAKNNIKTNYIKAKIENMQQKSKYSERGDGGEMFNWIISEWQN